MSTLPTISAKTPLPFGLGFDDVIALNWTPFGIGTRTIATVDSVTASPTGPLFSSLTPNAALIVGEHGQDVAIGKAATARMVASACVVDQDYRITFKVTYSDGKKDEAVLLAQCRAA